MSMRVVGETTPASEHSLYIVVVLCWVWQADGFNTWREKTQSALNYKNIKLAFSIGEGLTEMEDGDVWTSSFIWLFFTCKLGCHVQPQTSYLDSPSLFSRL